MVAPASRLGQQIAQVVTELNAAGLSFALIGGLALAAHRVVRATSDVDLLMRQEDQGAFNALAAKLGYRCLHQSPDAGNFVRADERLDVLFASRPAATRMLKDARVRQTAFGELRVVGAEGLIGLKLQALTNNPRRTRDLEDIRELLRANRGSLDIDQIRSYFKLFDREALLDELLADR